MEKLGKDIRQGHLDTWKSNHSFDDIHMMRKEILNIEFTTPTNNIVSNVSAEPSKDLIVIKNLLIEQIESRVRWRESIINMTNNGVNNFIEIGPGKVLSGLIKRINREVKVQSINNDEDIKSLSI